MERLPRTGGLDLAVLARFVDVAVDALSEAREEIDALNVYPVPDGDTGTNMFLTVSAARDSVREAVREAGVDGIDAPRLLEAFRRGALLGARGNSGVILSEMLGAIAHRVGEVTADQRNATVMAEALQRASQASFAAVGEPVDGTMLTVGRAAADAALEAATDPSVRARDVFAVAARAAREALAHTPEQLPALAAAGVVDAGGRGLCVLLDAAETVLTGRRPVPVTSRLGDRHIPVPHVAAAQAARQSGQRAGDDLTGDGPAYEVMYLLDAEEGAVTALRAALGPLGDSLVVVGGDGLWNVHVHVDDVGAAIEAGIEAGRPHRIRVTHFAEQIAGAREHQGAGASGGAGSGRTSGRTRQRAVIAVAAGDGLAELFAQAGAHVVRGGPGERPSTGQLLAAITACDAQEVVVLPNDSDSVRAAEIAARTAESDNGIRTAVIPTQAQVVGLAAIAVHEPGRSFDQDVLEMTATARHVRQGAVTIAAKQAMTMAGPCEAGDVLGVIAGDFALVGDDLDVVATAILDRLLAGGGELITLVSGGEGADGLATRTAEWVEREHPSVDVVVYDGGQPRYPLLMSVE